MLPSKNTPSLGYLEQSDIARFVEEIKDYTDAIVEKMKMLPDGWAASVYFFYENGQLKAGLPPVKLPMNK